MDSRTLRNSESATVAADHIQAAKRADILALLPGLHRHAKTSGGELHGPCPLCGGTDRLIAWPAHPKGARALCRQCHPGTMDAIALVQWLGKATTFPAAVTYLAGPGAQTRLTVPLPPVLGAPAPPAPYKAPYAWQEIAARYRYYTPDRPPIALADLLADTPGALARYDAAGGPQLLYVKERRTPGYHGKSKTFYLCRPRPGVTAPRPAAPADWYDGRGDLTDDQLWPYNWPAALAADPSAPLLWVDGEKDVQTAAAAGLVAVCGPDGGKSWQERWGPLFYGRLAVIIPDNDPSGIGQQQADRAAALIAPYADRVKLLSVPAGKDLTDWAHTLIGAYHVA